MSEEENVEKKPKKGDIAWSDFVMKQFQPDELKEGNPTVDGLRRVVESLLGIIIASESESIQVPKGDNRDTAVVKHSVVIRKHCSSVNDFNLVFDGIAEVNHRNTDDEFLIYPMAMAETRAEGRALRRALGLKKPAAEELTKTPVLDKDVNENDVIKDVQIKMVNTLCKRLKIDVEKFINSGEQQYDDIKLIKYKTALEMLKRLNVYQQEPDKIPSNLIIGD
jgi:hypothetical protein